MSHTLILVPVSCNYAPYSRHGILNYAPLDYAPQETE